jgi:hypothetical protein
MLEQRSAVKHYSGMPAVDHVSYSARSASSNESATFWITGDSEAIQTHLDWRIIAESLADDRLVPASRPVFVDLPGRDQCLTPTAQRTQRHL